MIMFVVRALFWLCLIVLLLPIDKDEIDPAVTQSISASSAFQLAAGAFSDLSEFCIRNPATCEQGAEAFAAFSIKAKYVSGVAYRYFNQTADEPLPVDGDAAARARQLPAD